MFSMRGCASRIAVAAAVIAGTTLLWSGPANAVTCPTLGVGGTVTPAPAPGVDWSGCRLAGADLSGADLSGADLSRANLLSANLTGSNLSHADLTAAAIDNSKLADTDLSGTIFTNVLTVLGVSSGGITGTPASLPFTSFGQTQLIDGYLIGGDVDLDGADLASVDLAGIDFDDASFVGADLAHANLGGASVDGNVAGANLSGTNLGSAYLAGVSSGNLTGKPSALPANWRLVDGYLIGPDAELRGANLTGVDLAGADLHMTDFTGSNLTDADLAGANLSNAGLGQTTLTGANLSGADFVKIVSFSIIGTPAALPQHWALRGGYLLGPQVFLDQADLSGVNLSGLDLAGAFLEGCSFTSVDLSGTNLRGADLSGSTIAKAELARTVLAGASLYSIRSGGGITGRAASLPANWVLRSGWLIGPSVILQNQNLNGVNLSGTDMARAETDFGSFTGTNFSGADLVGSILGSDFTKADFDGADLFGVDQNGSTWADATCPDGTNSSSHHGSCAGAVAFRFAGFITPKPGSTVAVSAGHVSVAFKLATASGAAIPGSVAAAIGAAKRVRVTLAGPGIKPATAYCSRHGSGGEFACTITDPHGIRKGASHSYTITAAEKPGATFQTAPRLGKAANPEVIHFR